MLEVGVSEDVTFAGEKFCSRTMSSSEVEVLHNGFRWASVTSHRADYHTYP